MTMPDAEVNLKSNNNSVIRRILSVELDNNCEVR